MIVDILDCPRIFSHAKNIVLHLSKHRDRELTRQELLYELELEMTDEELEKKLKSLVKADIIQQGQTNYDYRGVGDNIFDKVFRGVYEKEIREFDVKVIKKEYSEELDRIKKQSLISSPGPSPRVITPLSER
jgi:hypothetical protein